MQNFPRRWDKLTCINFLQRKIIILSIAYYELSQNLIDDSLFDKYCKQLVSMHKEHGAIDHVALDVRDIEEIFQYINEAGLNSTQDTIHFLPFWENGVKFFTIEGPNKEKVEFSQYL